MVNRQKIQAFTSEVGRKFQPEKIMLFGSYANGEPSSDSDVDILEKLLIKRLQKRHLVFVIISGQSSDRD